MRAAWPRRSFICAVVACLSQLLSNHHHRAGHVCCPRLWLTATVRALLSSPLRPWQWWASQLPLHYCARPYGPYWSPDAWTRLAVVRVHGHHWLLIGHCFHCTLSSGPRWVSDWVCLEDARSSRALSALTRFVVFNWLLVHATRPFSVTRTVLSCWPLFWFFPESTGLFIFFVFGTLENGQRAERGVPVDCPLAVSVLEQPPVQAMIDVLHCSRNVAGNVDTCFGSARWASQLGLNKQAQFLPGGEHLFCSPLSAWLYHLANMTIFRSFGPSKKWMNRIPFKWRIPNLASRLVVRTRSHRIRSLPSPGPLELVGNLSVNCIDHHHHRRREWIEIMQDSDCSTNNLLPTSPSVYFDHLFKSTDCRQLPSSEKQLLRHSFDCNEFIMFTFLFWIRFCSNAWILNSFADSKSRDYSHYASANYQAGSGSALGIMSPIPTPSPPTDSVSNNHRNNIINRSTNSSTNSPSRSINCNSEPNKSSLQLIPVTGNHQLTREAMSRYIHEKNDLKIIILHAKVAQKSYGNEKRFFCPPPCIYLVGDGWRKRQEQMIADGESEQGASLCAFIGIGNSDQEMQQLDFSGKVSHFVCCMWTGLKKHYFFRTFALQKLCTLVIRTNGSISCFPSKCSMETVKILEYSTRSASRLFRNHPKRSSLSRTRIVSWMASCAQSANPFHFHSVCIQSGTNVALFNRLRSQTVSTRYLHVEQMNGSGNGNFHASSTQWGSFTIHLRKFGAIRVWFDSN